MGAVERRVVAWSALPPAPPTVSAIVRAVAGTAVVAVPVTLLAMLLVALTPAPASAHPTLLATVPQAGYAAPGPPREIALIFDEPVAFGLSGLVLRGQARGRIRTTPPAAVDGGRKLVVRPLVRLPDGWYVVRWRITAQDGDVVEGSFTFGVGTRLPAQPTAGTGSDTDSGGGGTRGGALVTTLRWLIFTGLAVALGGLAGARVLRGRLPDALAAGIRRAPQPWLLPGGLIGLAGAVGLLGYLAAAESGALLASRPRQLAAVEGAAFAAAATAAAARIPAMAAAALTVVVVAEGLRGHLQAETPWGALVGVVHLAAAALWVGALLHVLRAVRRLRVTGGDVSGGAGALFTGYAALAVWLWLATLVSGTVAALALVPSPATLTETAYGRVLLVKLILIVVLSLLAVLGRRRIRRPARTSSVRAAPVVGYARAESRLLVAVLAVAAVLTVLPSPTDPDRVPAPPPLVLGPSVRQGVLAGQVTTGLVATQGGLEVRLWVPEADPAATQRFRLTGALIRPGGGRSALAFRPCGPGCFVARAPWRPGSNIAELTVVAQGWAGTTTRIDVPWPPRERPDLLRAVLRTMPAQRTVVMTETVTSDTTRPTPPPRTYRRSGVDLLDAQPYRSGVTSPVVMLARHRQATEIAFAIPAENVHVRLLVDHAGRILREDMVTPGHLIHRTYDYPAPAGGGR